MADDAKTLKLLIEMGVIGKDDVKAANDLLAETNQGTEKLAVTHRELHQILHLIAREAGPEAAAILGTIGAASGGGLMIGVMAARELFTALKQIQEEAAKAQEAVRKTFVETLTGAEDAHDAIIKLGEESEKFWTKLAQHQAGETAKSGFAAVLQDIKNATTEATKLISEMEKAGLITKEGAEAKTAGIEAGGIAKENQARAYREAALEMSLDALTKQLAISQAASTGAGHEGYLTDLAQAKKDLDAAKAAFEAGKSFMPQSGLLAGTLGFDQKNSAAYGGDATKYKEAFAAELNVMLAKIQAAEKHDADVAAHESLLQTKISALTEEIDKLHEQIAAGTADIAKIQTEQSQGAATDDFGKAKSTADKLAGGGSVSAGDAQYLILLEQAITGKKQTLETAVRLIELQSKSSDTAANILTLHAGTIQQVQKRLDDLEKRATNTNRKGTTG